MNVESNYAIAITKLSDWFKKRKTKTNRYLHVQFFQPFEQLTQKYYKFGLVHCVVCTCCGCSK